jgi:hypothetical protein
MDENHRDYLLMALEVHRMWQCTNRPALLYPTTRGHLLMPVDDFDGFEQRFGQFQDSAVETDAEEIVWALLQEWGWTEGDVKISQRSTLPLRDAGRRLLKETLRIRQPNGTPDRVDPDFLVRIDGGVVIIIEAKAPSPGKSRWRVPTRGPWTARLHAELGYCLPGRPLWKSVDEVGSYANRAFRLHKQLGPYPHRAVLTNGFDWLVFNGEQIVAAWTNRHNFQEEDRPDVVHLPLGDPETGKAIRLRNNGDLQLLRGLLGRRVYESTQPSPL